MEARGTRSWTCRSCARSSSAEPGTIDPYGYWRGVREIDEAGAVLVRPDGYVAWRQSAAVWDDDEALRQLTDALEAVLARPATTSGA